MSRISPRLAGLALAVVATLVASVAAPIASAGGDQDHGWSQMSEEQHQKGLANAESHGLFAKFTYNTGTGQVTGRYLFFHLASATGAIHAVNSNDGGNATLMLTGVTPSAFALGNVTAKGSLLDVQGAPVSLKAHNNPTGGILWKASGAVTLTFTLPTGAVITPAGDHQAKVVIGTRHAHIMTNGNVAPTVAGLNVTVTLAAGQSAAFRAHPVKGGETLHKENEWFEKGNLGAQLRIADAGGVAAEDGSDFDVRAHTKSIAKGRVVLDIASDQHEARIVALAIDAGTLDPSIPIVATLNGTALVRGDQTTLAPGQFAVVPAASGGSVTVLVYVSHFSSYALALVQTGALSSGSSTTGASPTTSGTGSAGASSSGTAGAPALGMVALAALVALAAASRRWA